MTEGWPVKFSAVPPVLDKLQQHGFCALKPNETNLFNQQEFLWNCLIKAPRLKIGWVALSDAVAHDQDSDREIQKQSVAIQKHLESTLSRPVRRSQVH